MTDMTLNTFNGTYQHKGVPYVALAGKVYRVESLGTSWRIKTAANHGPFVYRDSAGQWLLDTRQKIARYGQAFGRLQDRADVSASARTSMNIEAVGMSAIRQLYPERARMIVEAIDLATFYVQNCKLNLALLAPGIAPVTRIHRFVNSFFGIDINPDHGPQEIAPTLVQKLHRIVDQILAGLLDPSLYALDSKRFVVGSHRIDPQNNWGFTIDNDPDRRIFLTERFFCPALQRLRQSPDQLLRPGRPCAGHAVDSRVEPPGGHDGRCSIPGLGDAVFRSDRDTDPGRARLGRLPEKSANHGLLA
ncbi:hypothetical protein NHF41_11860 [Pseudomonas proteolytica]|nr:DUF6543 domain-containing protein [Pseudomonas proteolytica]USX02432.1 hypothetical protein NHF41_11860 [Pseudomonas proteolytica]